MARKFSKAAKAALDAVTGKRARIVVEHIIKHGSITTDDLKERYGYDHPPRAIKDVSDQGIPLMKAIVRKADGKRMAEYRFGNLDNITAGRAPTSPRPSKRRWSLPTAASAPCATPRSRLGTSRSTTASRTLSRVTAYPPNWT